LKPHIGAIEFSDHEQMLVADIPGLIPGAHANRGLGISFLKHIERCICLVFVIDLSSPQPWTQLDVLKYELQQYNPSLLQKAHAIVGNKIDLPGAEENLLELQKQTSLTVYDISAKVGNNVRKLIKHLRHIYDSNVKEET